MWQQSAGAVVAGKHGSLKGKTCAPTLDGYLLVFWFTLPPLVFFILVGCFRKLILNPLGVTQHLPFVVCLLKFLYFFFTSFLPPQSITTVWVHATLIKLHRLDGDIFQMSVEYVSERVFFFLLLFSTRGQNIATKACLCDFRTIAESLFVLWVS